MESLIKFPCEYEVKAFGLNNENFVNAVTSIFTQHIKAFNADTMLRFKPSKNGKYSVSKLTFTATNKEELDTIYQALKDSEDVIMSL